MTNSFRRDDETERHSAVVVQRSRPEMLAGILRKRIEDHELHVGARLPAEKALAAHFGVSRAVVREAVQRLKAEGLIETMQGSGAYVRSPDQMSDTQVDRMTRASVESLLDLIEVRRVTEAAMAARAAERRTDQQMAGIDAALAALTSAENSGMDGVAEDRAFHASIAVASGNIYWRKLIDAFARHVEVAMSVTRGNEALRRDFSLQMAAEHQALRDAVADRDPERARAAASHHMEMSAERTLSADREFWRQAGADVKRLPKAD
jgi:DNA-binding FadR family transcriptional regulator